MAIAAAAAGSAVVGSILGGIGASKRAKALKKAMRYNIKDVRKFTTDQLERSDKLGQQKQTYLEEGDPFTDMGRFIFGDPSKDTYANLRKSQSDFAQLAAGNTSNFSREVASIVQSSLANTFGGPRGSFENTSAKNLLSFRQSGLQSALGLTDFFNRTGSQLTNAKFGILDQTFERQINLRQNQLNQVNALRLGRAQQSGTGWMAAGNVFTTLSGALSNFGMAKSNETALTDQKNYNDRYLDILGGRAGQSNVQNVPMAPPRYNNAPLPTFGGDVYSQQPQYNPYLTLPYYINGRETYASPAMMSSPPAGFSSSAAGAYVEGAVLPPP
jgi:hypothetical protein